MVRSTVIFAAATAVILVAQPASATRVKAMDLATLVSHSDVVVRGRVLSQKAVWDARRQRIYTHSLVIVDEVLRGRGVGDVVTVRQLGGSIGDMTQVVEGAGRLRLGGDVVVFLIRGGPLHYVVGMAQGRLSVVKRGGQLVVVRDLDGAVLVGKRPATLPVLYSEFKAAVVQLSLRDEEVAR